MREKMGCGERLQDRFPACVSGVAVLLLVLVELSWQEVCCGAPPDAATSQSVRSFRDRSNALNLNSRPAAELVALISEYEQLITRSRETPGVEWAMWDLARLHSSRNDENGKPIGDSLNLSIEWFRQAVATAPAGEGLWKECQLGLVAQLHRRHDLSMQIETAGQSPIVSQQNSEATLRHARQILDDVKQKFPEDPATQLRCNQGLVTQLLAEGQLADAEKVVHDMIKTASFEPPELLRTCRSAALYAFLRGALIQQGQAGVSDERLQAFLDDAPGDLDVAQAVETFRGMRAGWTSAPQPVAKLELLKPEPSRITKGSRVLATTNLVAVAVVITALIFQRLAHRSDS